jgi:hypothetical protein
VLKLVSSQGQQPDPGARFVDGDEGAVGELAGMSAENPEHECRRMIRRWVFGSDLQHAGRIGTGRRKDGTEVQIVGKQDVSVPAQRRISRSCA